MADTIAAFAPGMFFIYGFSLSRRGIDELISVNGPPNMSPQVTISTVTSVSLGYKCTYSKNTNNIAEANNEAMNIVLLKVGLKYEPMIPPQKVLTAHRTAMILDYLTIPIIER